MWVWRDEQTWPGAVREMRGCRKHKEAGRRAGAAGQGVEPNGNVDSWVLLCSQPRAAWEGVGRGSAGTA